MAEFSKSTITIDAPINAVQEALFALDKYPDWSAQIKSAGAIARDDQGRITKVKMSIDEDTTEVTYELEVSLSMPIPAMMRQKAEKATIDAALSQLKTHLEG